MEPDGARRDLCSTVWPRGEDHLLARAGADESNATADKLKEGRQNKKASTVDHGACFDAQDLYRRLEGPDGWRSDCKGEAR
jgi:hypothetical protein